MKVGRVAGTIKKCTTMILVNVHNGVDREFACMQQKYSNIQLMCTQEKLT